MALALATTFREDWPPQDFLSMIIEPVLCHLGKLSREMSQLLLGTAIHESGGLVYREQIRGPALSYFQMEPATHDDIWKNYLPAKHDLRAKVESLVRPGANKLDELRNNDNYAAAMACVHYVRCGVEPPEFNDLQAQAIHWSYYYNTRKDLGTQIQYKENWGRSIPSPLTYRTSCDQQAASPSPSPSPPPTVINGNGAAHFPFDLGGGPTPNDTSTAAYYSHTELDHEGGYFPIGTNTVWHGGVHLHAPRGTPIRALWDGKLVAARLPDSQARANGHYGSRNFVMLAHEVSGAALNRLASKGKVVGYELIADNVRLRDRAGTEGTQIQTKLHRGDEVRRLDDEEPTANGYTWAHVEVERASATADVGRKGYMAVHGDWAKAIREAKQIDELDEQKTYTFYSLYMHLGREKLDGSSTSLDHVRWLHAAPSASTETLTKAVGEPPCPNQQADVIKVQERLKAHGIDGAFTPGVYDEATKAAIGVFQQRMIDDGIITAQAAGEINPQGKTWPLLQQAPKDARPTLDDELVGKLREGAVVALDRAVSGGDMLWTSGDYGSPGYRAELIHWEIFSAEALIPGWTKVEDDDDDFNLDNAQIVGQVQQDSGWWENDEVLSLDEIVRFYTEHPNAKLLRQYQCKFISEWAVDPDVAIPKMLGAGLFSTVGLKERMEPYLWWNEAKAQGVALPDAKCWHYNPIAFADALARIAEGAAGGHVYVRRNGQRVPHYAQGSKPWGELLLRTLTISGFGCAITAVSMVLKYYGRDVDPKIMDEFLDANNGYSGNDVIWTTAIKCGAVPGGVVLGNYRRVETGFKAILDQRISENKPTVVGVDYLKATDPDDAFNHFVVIVGRHKDGYYIMNDPATRHGNGAQDPSDENLVEKTTRSGGYKVVRLDLFDPV